MSKCKTYLNDRGQKVYKLIDTEIVKYDNTRVMLNTGGWRTMTTLRHMNDFLRDNQINIQVAQKKKSWYAIKNGKELPFKDRDVLVLSKESDYVI